MARTVAVIGLLLLTLTAQSAAQEQSGQATSNNEQKKSSASANQPPSNGSVGEPNLPGDVRYLPNADGQLIPVPADGTLEEYLEWRRSNAQPKADEGPPFSITSIELAGRAIDDRAELTAKVHVKLDRNEQWVRIPLAMKEATLRNTGYEGDGKASPDKFEPNATGYTWWLRGQGEHTIVLDLIVPVQATSPGERLQLSLPPSPVSRLDIRLDVPRDRLSINAPEDYAVRKSPADDGATRVEALGLGTRLELNWRTAPLPNTSKPVLQAQTSIRLELAGGSMSLVASQSVKSLSSSFNQLSVQLPPGLRLMTLEGPAYRSHTIDDNGMAVVTLDEPTSGPVELRWTFESESPAAESEFVLEGFRIEGASEQWGEISIDSFDGFRLTMRGEDSRLVHRIPPNDSMLEGRSTVRSYRFRSQPFRLAMSLENVEPEFTTEPTFLMNAAADQLELICVLQVEVFQGAVQELTLSWPEFGTEGWTIEPIQSPRPVERVVADRSHNTVRISLAEPKSGEFEVRFKARRSVPSDEGPFSLHLPSAVSSADALFVVARADNVKVDIEPNAGTSMDRISDDSARLSVELPQEFSSLSRTVYTVNSSERDFLADVSVQQQRVFAESTIRTELREERLLVTQQIDYDVAYERIAQLRLVVPKSLLNRVEFQTADGERLVTDWSGFEVGNAQQARVALPQPELGDVAIVARYVLDVPEDVASVQAASSIPVIQSLDAGYSAVRFEFQQHDRVDAELADEQWTAQFPAEEASVWSTTAAVTEIPLRFEASGAHPAQGYSISKALVRTAVDNEGNANSTAKYVLEGDVSTLIVILPPTIELQRLWWNDRVLDEQEILLRPESPGTYRLRPVIDANETKKTLTVEFRTAMESTQSWYEMQSLACPRFAGDVWIEQNVWQVVLPYEQHLFLMPAGFTPKFRWQRELIFWNREPLEGYEDLAAWLGDDGGPENPELRYGNSYVFSRFGPAREIAFSSMSRSLVVLFGAGLSLAVGFLLLKIPATRNVLTLLILVFTVALLTLWFEAPVQLLLQPAILGLLLAVGAVLIESSLRKEPHEGMMSLSSPSDFILPPTSRSSYPPEQTGDSAGSAPTAVRRPASAPEPVSTSDSGSHV